MWLIVMECIMEMKLCLQHHDNKLKLKSVKTEK